MSLTLHFHPLSSFCQKVLIGLYELDVPFAKHVVDLRNEAERAAFLELWPIGKFPVLYDEDSRAIVAESSIVLEYVELRCSRRGSLVPADPVRACECRLRDRFFDLYVNVPMGKIVTDKLRPEGRADPHGVELARTQLRTAYAVADEWLRRGPWALGDEFTLADCAAAPALFYANQVLPFDGEYRHLAEYFARLERRPSFARVLDEAQPYLAMFPGG
jgi:glutathione S-transferase